MTVGDELPHHDFRVYQVFRAAETNKSYFQWLQGSVYGDWRGVRQTLQGYQEFGLFDCGSALPMKLRQELTELRPSFRAMTACFTATSNVPWITLSAGYQGSQIVPPIRANSESLNGGRYMAANRNRAFSVLLLNCPTPLNATAYSLNITVVPHGSLDYLMVNGGINAFATDNTHLILDVTGYIAP